MNIEEAMTTRRVDPVAQAVVEAALTATAARTAWLAAVEGNRLVVVAAAGEDASAVAGSSVPAGTGAAGFAIASGQPAAVSSADGRFAEGIASGLPRTPSAVLCVPCESDDAIGGALELVDKRTGGGFSFDDVEIATLLGGIAAAALERRTAATVPSPLSISADLQRLERGDPLRYARVANVVSELLSGG